MPRRATPSRLPRVLILHTGGTLGMSARLTLPTRSASRPRLTRARLAQQIPGLERIARYSLEVLFERDSAHVGPAEWLAIARRVRERAQAFDGFVILHGTDTLAYTGAALTLLLGDLAQPVVLTGAQRPLVQPLSDAARNITAALTVAATLPKHQGPSVSVVFGDALFAAHAIRKRSSQRFEAFESQGVPRLADIGTRLEYHRDALAAARRAARKLTLPSPARARALSLGARVGEIAVAFLEVTPGFSARAIREGLLARVQALVLVVFASGTAPTHDPEFIALLRAARARRVRVIVTTHSELESLVTYEAGQRLAREGAEWAAHLTPECAWVKSWFDIATRKDHR